MCSEYVTFSCRSRAAKSALIDCRFAVVTEVWAQLHWSLVFSPFQGVCQFYHPPPHSNKVPSPSYFPVSVTAHFDRLISCFFNCCFRNQTVSLAVVFVYFLLFFGGGGLHRNVWHQLYCYSTLCFTRQKYWYIIDGWFALYTTSKAAGLICYLLERPGYLCSLSALLLLLERN